MPRRIRAKAAHTEQWVLHDPVGPAAHGTLTQPGEHPASCSPQVVEHASQPVPQERHFEQSSAERQVGSGGRGQIADHKVSSVALFASLNSARWASGVGLQASVQVHSVDCLPCVTIPTPLLRVQRPHRDGAEREKDMSMPVLSPLRSLLLGSLAPASSPLLLSSASAWRSVEQQNLDAGECSTSGPIAQRRALHASRACWEPSASAASSISQDEDKEEPKGRERVSPVPLGRGPACTALDRPAH